MPRSASYSKPRKRSSPCGPTACARRRRARCRRRARHFARAWRGTGGPASPAPAAAAQEKKKSSAKQRVVIQVSDNDPAKWTLALNNARNIQSDLGKDNVLVEIVAYGPGLEMMKAESKVADRLAAALDGNVGLIAC